MNSFFLCLVDEKTWLRYVEHIAHGQTSNTYRIWKENLRQEVVLEDNIKMDLTDIGCEYIVTWYD